MFMVHRRGVTRDGNAPTVLHGYGGFRLTMGSLYWSDLPVWLEHGGVYVTDSGLKPDFSSSGTDAVYHIGKDDKVHALSKDKALGAKGARASEWLSAAAQIGVAEGAFYPSLSLTSNFGSASVALLHAPAAAT